MGFIKALLETLQRLSLYIVKSPLYRGFTKLLFLCALQSPLLGFFVHKMFIYLQAQSSLFSFVTNINLFFQNSCLQNDHMTQGKTHPLHRDFVKLLYMFKAPGGFAEATLYGALQSCLSIEALKSPVCIGALWALHRYNITLPLSAWALWSFEGFTNPCPYIGFVKPIRVLSLLYV